MKKFYLFSMMLAVMISASADNYFSLRTVTDTVQDGTLRIDPARATGYAQLYAVAHFDGYLDHWYITMTHPDTMYIYVNPTDHDNTEI